MKIKTVHYLATINLGNYSNEKIGFAADIDEGETVEQVVEALRQKVRENGGTNADELYNTLYRGKTELRELEQKIAKARQHWEATAEFLKAQGLRPDAPPMPMFSNLLPEVKEEHVCDGEIEGDF